jgi:hypothetical protein
VGINTRAARARISANRPLTNYNSPNFATVQNDFALGLNVSYELDFFGRVRRSVEAAGGLGPAIGGGPGKHPPAADGRTGQQLLQPARAGHRAGRGQARHRAAAQGAGTGHLAPRPGRHFRLDVAQQQALLDNTLTQVDLLGRQRAQYEHAIATLTGTPAPAFSLPPSLAPIACPTFRWASRRTCWSAARTWLPQSAPWPRPMRRSGWPAQPSTPVSCCNPYGVDSRNWATLFNAPSVLWSLGVSASQSLFDAGRLRAGVDFTQAGYNATVATYRRTVLTAMQEVEDGITGIASLDRAWRQSQSAIASARRVLEIATSRYEGGATPYLDVITAQQALLNSERQAAQLMGSGCWCRCS